MRTIIHLALFCLMSCLFHPSGFAQEPVHFGGKYLIVLDIQDCWISKTMSDSTAEKLINTVNLLIEKINPDQVIYIQSPMRALSVSLRGIKTVTLPGVELDKRLHVVNQNQFFKYKGDAFTSQELCDYLNTRDAKQIVVTGLLAEKCVKHTLLGGLEKGYQLFVIPEAIVGKSEESKMKVIADLKHKGVHELSVDEL